MSESKIKKKFQLLKFLFKNIERKYLFDEGYLKNYRTNFSDKAYWRHQNEIARLRHKNNNHKKTVNTKIRAAIVVSVAFIIALFNDIYVPWFVANSDSIFLKITSVGVSGIVMAAPIAFVIWMFRDKNRLMELENARKDTNLKEFQQLQRWATGNIEGNKDNGGNKIALQISALHSLRDYLKGEYGESFRRGAYEIFRAALATQHQAILRACKKKDTTITIEINKCPLTKQLNIIANEEWFNLLINHNFSTNNISLVGVDLHKTYLHHRIYGKTLDLEYVQLQGVNLVGAQLQGADLERARLQRANLGHAQLQGVRLWGAQLQGADLEDAQLQGADLRYAQLQGVNLKGAQLQGADLIYAQLQGANLKGAQLQGADLMYVQLQGAYISDNFEFLSFEQRITQQIGEETTKKTLKEQYKALDETKKSHLIKELKAVKHWHIDEVIKRIKLASEILDLSEATTGTYSQEEADEWLNDYKKARK